MIYRGITRGTGAKNNMPMQVHASYANYNRNHSSNHSSNLSLNRSSSHSQNKKITKK